ncbi:MAG: radical SAM-associated putative lipoprotein [Bacteroidales bacterium]|nr:radical SAM-associated putative lipoprotein [Bacteroidales bacterium]
MKIRFLKACNWLLLSLIGLMGVESCASSKKSFSSPSEEKDPVAERHEMMLMYGVPTRNYREVPRAIDEPIDHNVQKSDTNTTQQRKSNKRRQEGEARIEQPVMYGVPTVDFHVRGQIVDEKNRPVKGIQVMVVGEGADVEANRMPESEYWQRELLRMADTSQTDGRFDCQGSARINEQVRLLIRDVDGTKNGDYENQLLLLNSSILRNTRSDQPVSENNPSSELKIVLKKKTNR